MMRDRAGLLAERRRTAAKFRVVEEQAMAAKAAATFRAKAAQTRARAKAAAPSSDLAGQKAPRGPTSSGRQAASGEKATTDPATKADADSGDYLPRCHKHPAWLCPGECQYVLGPDECLVAMLRAFYVLKGVPDLTRPRTASAPPRR